MQLLGYTFTGFTNLLGDLLYFLYSSIKFNINQETVHSYGLAIIILTIIVKFVLMPLSIKSIKANMKMQELQPELKAIQERYKNDKEKMQQELMKFYQEKKFNPAGGCLPILLQAPVFFLILKVFSYPLTYMLHIEQYIPKISTAMFDTIPTNTESTIIQGFTPQVANKLVSEDIISSDIANKILDMNHGMHFLGINLTKIPSYDVSQIFSSVSSEYLLLLLIPIFSFITMYISSKLSMVTNNSDINNPQVQMARKMLWLGPIMSFIFAFQFPAALGLYWIASNVFQIFQQLYVNKFIKIDKQRSKEVVIS